MKTIKDVKNLSAEFKQNWFKYVVLFMSLDVLNQFVLIPLFRIITTFVLQMGAIPFVSYSNLQIKFGRRIRKCKTGPSNSP